MYRSVLAQQAGNTPLAALHKRLERGEYQWPRHESEARQLTKLQYRQLMEGLRVDYERLQQCLSDKTRESAAALLQNDRLMKQLRLAATCITA